MRLDDARLYWNNDRYKFSINSNIQGAAGFAASGRTVYFDIPSLTVNAAGDHAHTVTAAGTVSSAFYGNNGATSAVGSGTAINQLQPYIVTYMWKRIA